MYQRLLVFTLGCTCCLCPCALNSTRSSCNLSPTPMHHHYAQHFSGQHCPADGLHSSSGSTLLARHHAFTCQSIQGMLNIRHLPQKCVCCLLKPHQPTALLACTQPSWELACSASAMGWVQQAPAVEPSFKSSRFCELSGDTYSQCHSDGL